MKFNIGDKVKITGIPPIDRDVDKKWSLNMNKYMRKDAVIAYLGKNPERYGLNVDNGTHWWYPEWLETEEPLPIDTWADELELYS